MQPYATSHDELDRDTAFQEEVRNAARALVQAVKLMRRGELQQPDASLNARARSKLSDQCPNALRRRASGIRASAAAACAGGGPAASTPTGSASRRPRARAWPYHARRAVGSGAIWRSTTMTVIAPATSSICVA